MKSFSQFLQESYLNEAGVPDDYEEYMRKYSGTPKKLAQMSDADFNARFGNNPKMNVARDIGQQQGRLLNRKNQAYKDINNPNPGNRGYATDPTPTPVSRRLSAGAPEAPKTSPGQLEIPEPKTTKVPGSKVRSAGEVRQPSLITKSGGAQDFTKAGKGKVPFTSSEPVKATKRLSAGAPKAPKVSPGQMEIDFDARPNRGGALVKTSPSTPATRAGKLATTSSTKPAKNPPIQAVNVRDITPKQKALPSAGQTSASKPQASAGKLPTGAKPTGKFAKVGKLLGPAATALDVGLSTADERAKGSGWARSLAKGATVAAGGLLGGAAGAIGGGGLGSAALGTAGAIGGAELAGRAFDTVAGANARERKAIATANRQRQSGTAIKGIGGQTTFSQKKPGGPAFMSTGSGSQRRTVQLAKTGVVQRGSQSTAGHLAFKGGKAVYKAGPSAQSLAKTSSNPLERVGRTLFAGAYKKHDAAKAQQALQKARQNDAARNKKLGVKALPGK